MTSPLAGNDPSSAGRQPSILEGQCLRRVAGDGTVLLNDVSFTVVAREAVGVVGPPGSGKTLLLRALALLDPLDGGEVRFQGEPVIGQDVPAFRRKVLYVQQRATFIEGTVRDNLMLPFLWRSAGDAAFEAARAEKWLETAGRGRSFLERSVADLSGGESQLIALVRALQLDPSVLLLDEPTSSLDVQTGERVEGLLRDWKRQSESPALVIVTHDEAQAERMADRRVRLETGRIVADGQTS